ncbi:DUF4288 domain-containing protein [Povalibacter sp.]|uniref:DUF4288 domain-containing protein n=1 Tax=Povalibacter sp. TaxID=1962978 RepID=UPI0039C9485D
MWFAVSLFYESQHSPDLRSSPLWEESICLVDTPTQEDAVLAGEEIGKRRASSYLVDSATVSWVFRGVQRAYPIESDEIASGVEVFSRFLRDSEAQSLLTPFEDE